MEANALWAKEVRGYEGAIRNLFEYLNTPVAEKATAETYPAVDAEDAWPEDLRTPAPLKPPPLETQIVPNEAEQTPEALVPDEVPQPE